MEITDTFPVLNGFYWYRNNSYGNYNYEDLKVSEWMPVQIATASNGVRFVENFELNTCEDYSFMIENALAKNYFNEWCGPLDISCYELHAFKNNQMCPGHGMKPVYKHKDEIKPAFASLTAEEIYKNPLLSCCNARPKMDELFDHLDMTNDILASLNTMLKDLASIREYMYTLLHMDSVSALNEKEMYVVDLILSNCHKMVPVDSKKLNDEIGNIIWVGGQINYRRESRRIREEFLKTYDTYAPKKPLVVNGVIGL